MSEYTVDLPEEMVSAKAGAVEALVQRFKSEGLVSNVADPVGDRVSVFAISFSASSSRQDEFAGPLREACPGININGPY